VQIGAGRAPLIIAGIAALVTYAALGHQTPFAFLHHLGGHHHTITVSTDKSDAADEARQAAEDRAQEEADRAQEIGERAKEIAAAAVDAAKGSVAAIPPIPAIPPVPAIPAIPAVPSESGLRTLEPFDSVTIENNATAEIAIGDSQSVSIYGGAGQTETRVHDGKLTVSGSSPGVHIAITLPHLRALQVNGYGQIDLQGLRDPIAITTNGSVHLTAAGSVDSADLILNGPSKLSLSALIAKNVNVHVNGVGNAEVYATQNLTAEVSGVGRVRYLGDPHTVATIHGMGKVERLAPEKAG
jgi:hypothetical protein